MSEMPGPKMSNQRYLGYLPDARFTLQLKGLHVREADSSWTYPSHEHPMYEIHWIVEGEQHMIVEGQTYHQHKGDLLFIRPGMTHSCKSAGPEGLTYFSVHFSVNDRALSMGLERRKDVYFPAASPLVKQLSASLTTLYNLAKENVKMALPTSKQMKVLSAVFDLFSALVEELSKYAEETKPTRTELVAGEIARNIEEAVRNVMLHGQSTENQKTWIHDIAKKLMLSTSQINRVFKQVYGMAPRTYMSEVLLQEAKRLLGQTDLSVDHVAMMLGYRTNAHFSRQFKRWTGIAPSVYRSTLESDERQDRI